MSARLVQGGLQQSRPQRIGQGFKPLRLVNGAHNQTAPSRVSSDAKDALFGYKDLLVVLQHLKEVLDVGHVQKRFKLGLPECAFQTAQHLCRQHAQLKLGCVSDCGISAFGITDWGLRRTCLGIALPGNVGSTTQRPRAKILFDLSSS